MRQIDSLFNRRWFIWNAFCAGCWILAIVLWFWKATPKADWGQPSRGTTHSSVHRDAKELAPDKAEPARNWDQIFREKTDSRFELTIKVPEEMAFNLQPGLTAIRGLPGEWNERACTLLEISESDRRYLEQFSKRQFKQIIQRESECASRMGDSERGEWVHLPADARFYEAILDEFRNELATRCGNGKLDLAMAMLRRTCWFQPVNLDREVYLEPGEDGVNWLRVSELQKDGSSNLIQGHRLGATSRLVTSDIRYQHLMKITGWVTKDIETDPVK